MTTTKRHCDYHYSEPVEAEPVARGKVSYLQLRCPECGRKRGLRLVRRTTAI